MYAYQKVWLYWSLLANTGEALRFVGFIKKNHTWSGLGVAFLDVCPVCTEHRNNTSDGPGGSAAWPHLCCCVQLYRAAGSKQWVLGHGCLHLLQETLRVHSSSSSRAAACRTAKCVAVCAEHVLSESTTVAGSLLRGKPVACRRSRKGDVHASSKP
jgi:hypothetical protein